MTPEIRVRGAVGLIVFHALCGEAELKDGKGMNMELCHSRRRGAGAPLKGRTPELGSLKNKGPGRLYSCRYR